MIKKRLIKLVPQSKKYIALCVLCQWIGMVSNVIMIFLIAQIFEKMIDSASFTVVEIAEAALSFIGVIFIRFMCAKLQQQFSFEASCEVKKTLRQRIFEKLSRLGASYNERVATSEVVQLTVEGVDQLESYFGAYLPQLFYSMLAPLTLFAVLSFLSIKAAAVLLICVPLIPIAIMLVQKIAKKLLSKYWGQYTALGNTFLENLQGLTTLKIYQSDEYKNQKMNEEAQNFRKITMKVLTMQLNSVTIMDFVAYGGAALGIIIAAMEFSHGNIDFAGCFSIIMLSADFFIPMRKLGSYFHVAMNGMAASDKIFNILDLKEPESGEKSVDAQSCDIKLSGVSFSYDSEREVLNKIDMDFPMASLTAIAGESGCGKSTVAAILTGRNKGFLGEAYIGESYLSEISEQNLMKSITYIGHNAFIFKGSVKYNLLFGKPDASDEELWEVLERTKLADFVRSEGGLYAEIHENAQNLSGGQRQRLALARALLHDSPIYIFDEATSNIDVESEADIMEQIYLLAETKTVIVISHRLANIKNVQKIYVLDGGRISESGTHKDLVQKNGQYARLWGVQQSLESIGNGAV